jgi:hypothetical protein
MGSEAASCGLLAVAAGYPAPTPAFSVETTVYWPGAASQHSAG